MSTSSATTPLPEHRVLVDEDGAYVFYQPAFLTADEADMYYNVFNEMVPWTVETDDYGKQDRATHYMADTGCTFSYVGLENKPNKWSPEVLAIRKKVEATINNAYNLMQKLDLNDTAVNKSNGGNAGDAADALIECKGCLLNKYESGERHIPWHSDTVTDHGAAKLVATVSLGAPRLIHFRRAASGGDGDGDGGAKGGVGIDEQDPEVSQMMASGSLTVMAGTTQEVWQHRIPADPDTAEGRISLTFRSMEPIPPHHVDHVGDTRDLQDASGGHAAGAAGAATAAGDAEKECEEREAAFLALIAAAKEGSMVNVNRALANGVDAAQGDRKGETPLHHASARGHVDCVHALLAFGTANDGSGERGEGKRTATRIPLNVNAPSITGASPLVAAAVKGRHDAVAVLLADPRVDPNHVGLRGRGAIHGAVMHGHPRTVEVLLRDSRLNPNVVDHEGRSVLVDAARKNRPHVMKLLLDCKRLEKETLLPAARAAAKAELGANPNLVLAKELIGMLGL